MNVSPVWRSYSDNSLGNIILQGRKHFVGLNLGKPFPAILGVQPNLKTRGLPEFK